MTAQPDYYRILQVHPRAEREVIDAAYRRLAAKYHPDVSPVPGAEERMKQINTAYEVLSDPVKRAAYDASRDFAYPSGTPPHAAERSRHPSSPWRTLLIAAGFVLIAAVVIRLVPSILVLAARIVLPMVVVFLVVYLLFTLVKQRR